MRKHVRCLMPAVLAGGLAIGAAVPLSAQQVTSIGVSYQPAVYWAVPYYIATEKGWWKEVGLDPKFTTFASGAPQVAAAASKSWDVGGTGSAPAVLGSQRFNILTIGITNDEFGGQCGDGAEQRGRANHEPTRPLSRASSSWSPPIRPANTPPSPA